MKKTLVLGASVNPERYAYKATVMLKEYGHPVIPHGLRKGDILGTEIETELPILKDIDTVTLYLGPQNQTNYMEYIVNLQPKRVIFNPGTENQVFENRLKTAGIEALEACTLVLLRTGQY